MTKNAQLLHKSSPSATPQKIETLEDLLISFTRGFVPDLSDPKQKDAFELYRVMRFGDPNTSLQPGMLEEVTELLQKYPNLKKEQFRNYSLKVLRKKYPVSEELATFINSQLKSAGKVKSNLFQVESNKGYWKKVLGYEEPSHLKVKPQNKAEKRILQEQSKKHYQEFLDKNFPKSLQTLLADTEQPIKIRIKKLYDFLISKNEELQKQGKKTKDISRAIVDLIHTAGYHDNALLQALKSKDGLERLNAFKQILNRRDSLAIELGYVDHFEQVLKDFSIPSPTGIENSKKLGTTIQRIENNILGKAEVVDDSSSTRTVRHLTLAESPFRSCIGGSDCSSNTYLSKALDPNYHYFTLTDDQGFSSGHITIVLGEANHKGKQLKVAFVDKVQNVDNLDLPLMMEAVRKSVKEKGYTLSIPDSLGEHNGISNEVITRDFIKTNIKTTNDKGYQDFKPHKHEYDFPNRYSRAEEQLSLNKVLKLESKDDAVLSPKDLYPLWKDSSFDLNKLVQKTIQLKNGDLEEKLRYLPSMMSIENAGLKSDPELDDVLKLWLSNTVEPFKLRKQVLIHEITENRKSLLPLLKGFSPDEKVDIIQNLLDTPRFRNIVLADDSVFQEYIIIARKSKNLRKKLISQYSSRNEKAISLLLDADDISNEAASIAVKTIKEKNHSLDINKRVEILEQVRDKNIYSEIEQIVLDDYIALMNSDAALGRKLAENLNSGDSNVLSFMNKIISLKHNPIIAKKFPILKTYDDLLSLKLKSHDKSFDNAAKLWIQDKSISATEKADFLMSQIGSRDRKFNDFEKLLPKHQVTKVWKKINQDTSFSHFQNIGKQNSIPAEFFQEGKVESFQFIKQPFSLKDKATALEHSYEIQATPVTQLQWTVVMGENPSRHSRILREKEILLNGKRLDINFNNPVESVSYDEIQTFIKKLNESQNEYNYRLPTQEEWRYTSKGGNETKFSFGDESDDLSLYAWHSHSTHGGTKPVAELRPNNYGLYDTNGNVWEQTSTASENSSDLHYAMGGSYDQSGSYMRSDFPGRQTQHDEKSSAVGFRLVRSLR